MPLAHFNDPKHWRDRAEEARVIADQLSDPEAKRMLVIADDYDKLADRADYRMAMQQSE
jgi:hypothetical protein